MKPFFRSLLNSKENIVEEDTPTNTVVKYRKQEETPTNTVEDYRTQEETPTNTIEKYRKQVYDKFIILGSLIYILKKKKLGGGIKGYFHILPHPFNVE